MALLANDLIMSGTLIRSFGHLQNLSIILEDIGRARTVQQFQRRNGRTERKNGGTERRSTVVLDERMDIVAL